MYEKATVQDDDRHNRSIGSSADDGTGDLITDPLKRSEEVDEVGAAGKKSAETLKAGEKIIEALDIWEHEVAVWKDYKQVRNECIYNVKCVQF